MEASATLVFVAGTKVIDLRCGDTAFEAAGTEDGGRGRIGYLDTGEKVPGGGLVRGEQAGGL